MKKNNKKIYSRELKTGYNDYKNMPHEFRPYVMFTNGHNYKSKSVNTDRCGFRKVFYNNKYIGIDDLKKTKKPINILLGGSVAFGTGSPTDRNTIQSELTALGKLCFSLGIRAGSSHQDIIAFLKFKNFFPKIKSITIISGINDLGIASEHELIFYPDFGAILGARFHALNFFYQTASHYKEKWIKGLTNLFFYLSFLSQKSKIFKKFLTIFSYFKQSKLQKRSAKFSLHSVEEKIKNINKMLDNDLEILSIFKKQLGIKVFYIFQPNLAWIYRPKTEFENEIIKSAREKFKKYYDIDLTSKNIYINQKKFIKNSCEQKGIKFIDGNEIFLKSEPKKSYFIDLTHLNSYGNKFVAKQIYKLIN